MNIKEKSVFRLALSFVAVLAFILVVSSYGNTNSEDSPDAVSAEKAGEERARRERREFPRKNERDRMVARQIKARGVTDDKMLDAMRAVPRHLFVPNNLQRQAYDDNPLPIGYGQTISQPYIVGLMTELLNPQWDSKSLEIGTGSGYQAAVLAELVRDVYSIEIVEGLYKNGTKALIDAGYDDVKTKHGDGFYGWEEHAPFDTIIVTAAASHIPPPLIKQLKPGGRMVIPVGPPHQVQRLVLVTKDEDENITTRDVLTVRFVPLTREVK